jgi:hypothetical protein
MKRKSASIQPDLFEQDEPSVLLVPLFSLGIWFVIFK